MFIRLFTLCFCVLFYTHSALGEDAYGQIGASIVDPATLSLEDLKKMCKDEPQTTACEIYEERVLDEEVQVERVYGVLTANFQ